MSRLLEVKDLKVGFHTEEGVVQAVDGVSFEVERGKTLGIVGESGCGKSVTAMSLLGLTRGEHTDISGSISFEGRDLAHVDAEALREIRGNGISMIFQDPLTSLHPFFKVGAQITEAIDAHEQVSKQAATDRAIELLDLVGIPDPQRRFGEYPHEFSGGMRQRAMIAMALVNDPQLLIADEPTTALDVTIQAQIIELLKRLQRELGMAVIMITHDLGVVADIADSILVMYAGRVVEQGSLDEIFYDPQHPYSWGLLGSVTRVDRARSARLAQIKGQPPSLLAPPVGCHFQPRCPHAHAKCKEVPPLQVRAGAEHADRCWLAAERKRELRQMGDGEIGLEEPGS